MAWTWSTDVTLGRVSRKPSVRPPARTSSPRNRSRVRRPRRRVGASNDLNRIPWNGAAFPSCTDCGQGAGGGDRGGVLLGVRAVAEAVLEVDPQVLDRLGLELPADQGVHDRGDLDRHTRRVGELLRCAAVRVERRECLAAPVGDGGRGVAVGRDVDGVHRLAHTAVARVVLGERGVGRGELLVEGVGEAAHPGRRRRTHAEAASYAGRVRKST